MVFRYTPIPHLRGEDLTRKQQFLSIEHFQYLFGLVDQFAKFVRVWADTMLGQCQGHAHKPSNVRRKIINKLHQEVEMLNALLQQLAKTHQIEFAQMKPTEGTSLRNQARHSAEKVAEILAIDTPQLGDWTPVAGDTLFDSVEAVGTGCPVGAVDAADDGELESATADDVDRDSDDDSSFVMRAVGTS